MLFLIFVLASTLASKCDQKEFQTEFTFSQTEICSSDHISASLETTQDCKPRPVILQLPWPNNTNVQQVNQKKSFPMINYYQLDDPNPC